MAITYHAGRRIQGTAADRAAVDAVTGGWVEVGRTTLGSSGDTIDVTSLPDKRYYMILMDYRDTGGQINTSMTINNDTGNNYARRWSTDGGTDSTQTSRNSMNHGHYTANDGYAVAYLSNVSSKEKLLISHSVANNTGTGAGTAPNRNEFVGKWANTSNVVSSIKHTNSDTGSFTSGSEVVVLGYDPDDTHTTNFWEELASVQGDGTSTTLSSGTIQSKKYLWVQGFTGDAGGANNSGLQFNSDTGSNYATRRNLDGQSSDTLWTSESYTQLGTSTNCFFNTFIINNSANEKLAITYWVQRLSTGAGNAPSRGEFVGKWANTSSQITNVSLVQQTTSINWGTDVHLKVWGSN